MRFSLPVWSWALYDFANTIFYGVVVTMYLPNYVIEKCGGEHLPYTLATIPAMLLAAILAPALGEIADRSGRSRWFVGVFSLLCATASCLLAIPTEPLPILVLFALALLAYNFALVFYNAMLPSVANDQDMARVSGLGVGVGYLGNVFAFPIARAVVAAFDGDPRAAFVVAGVLFMSFTIPLLMACKDRPPRPRSGSSRGALAAVRDNFEVSRRLVRDAVTQRGLLYFFLGNFLCADALNAVYQMMVPYIEGSVGLGLDKFWPMIGINIVAFPAAVWLGSIGDRTHPKPVMIVGALSFLAAVAVPQLLLEVFGGPDRAAHPVAIEDARPWQWCAAAALVVFGSFGVGGVLGAARKWLCRITPPEQHGGYFGIYGLTNKLSLIGLLMFSWLRDATGSYRGSVLFLVAELLIACALLGRAARDRAAPPEITAATPSAASLPGS